MLRRVPAFATDCEKGERLVYRRDEVSEGGKGEELLVAARGALCVRCVCEEEDGRGYQDGRS